MKRLGRLAGLLVVLGLCLPSYGEILVYKYTITSTNFEQTAGEWQAETTTHNGYIVIQIDYDDYSVTGGFGIRYRTDDGEKLYAQYSQSIELVRVPYSGKVQWLIMGKRAEVDGEEITGINFTMLAGGARNRNIGVPDKREVASTLSGYSLRDELGATDADREIEMISKLKFSLHPAWTFWANGDEGGQNLEAIEQKIVDYLEARGYTGQAQ
jgi:hypothetical protein